MDKFNAMCDELRTFDPEDLDFIIGDDDIDSLNLISELSSPLPSSEEKSRGRGRIPHHERYPELAPLIEQILSENGVAAEERRQNATAYGGGITIKEILNEIIVKMPELKGKISETTVRRIMRPPHDGRKAADRHHSIVDAKMVHRRNDALENANIDSQYASSQINQVLDLAFGFCEDECVVLSCDNKNKIDVGIPAVNTFHRPNGFCLTNFNPNMPDHTFPGGKECKLIPCGYMELKHRRKRAQSGLCPKKFILPFKRIRSQSPNRKRHTEFSYFDKMNRERVDYPRSGPLHLFLLPAYYYKSTSTRHLENLATILKPKLNQSGKSVVILITDGGPDWTTKSLNNILNFGRLWKTLNIDSLMLLRYAPGQSKFNMVERRWGPLTRRLSQVIFPLSLPGEHQSVFQQRLSKEEKEEKLRLVFNNATNACCEKWKSDMYNGHRIVLYPILSPKPGQVNSDEAHDKAHDALMSVSKSSANGQICKELKFFLSHCSRSLYKLEISKCNKKKCKCMESGVIKASKFFSFLNEHDGTFPTPSPGRFVDKNGKMHFRTFFEMLRCQSKSLDEHAPSGPVSSCGLGCRFVFNSKEDCKRHNAIMHAS